MELRAVGPLRVSEERKSGKAELAGLSDGLEVWVERALMHGQQSQYAAFCRKVIHIYCTLCLDSPTVLCYHIFVIDTSIIEKCRITVKKVCCSQAFCPVLGWKNSNYTTVIFRVII